MMKKRIIDILVILFLMSFLMACSDDAVLYTNDTTEQTTDSTIEETESLSSVIEDEKENTKEIAVHVCGAVNCPGVYLLKDQSRVMDAVNAAGGFSEKACQDYINLAQVVLDGSKVTIPTMEEAEDLKEKEEFLTVSNEHSNVSDSKSGLVNINTADVALLQTLTGVGAVRAQSIITYREEHGAFNSIEDIMKVSGIKQASYEKFKDEITVE